MRKTGPEMVPTDDRDRVLERGRVRDGRAGADVLGNVPDDVRERERSERDGTGRCGGELPSLDPREVATDHVHLAYRRA
jgi:hypothetical protein